MPIDFTGLYSSPSSSQRALPAATGAAPVSLLRGEVTEALVTRVAPADAAMRELLTAQARTTALKLDAALTGAGEANASKPNPALADSPANTKTPLDPRLQALLTSRDLQVAALRLRGQTLTTLTDQPVQKGQRVQVQLDAQQRLQLLPLRPATPAPGTAATDKAPGIVTSPRGEASHAPIAKPVEAIRQVLRQLLPQQDRPALLAELPQVQKALTHLPATPARAALENTLQQLVRAALPLNNAAPPAVVSIKQAVANSGFFLEPRLGAAINNHAPSAHIQQLLNSDIKALLLRVGQLTRPEAVPALIPPPALPGIPTTAANTPPGPAAPSPATGGESRAVADMTKPPAMALPGLLQLLGNTPPAGNEMRNLQTQLVVLLHQMSLSNLARVRTGQLTAESPRARAPEGAQSQPASVIMELPVRHEGQMQSVHLRIEEEDEKENPSDAQTQARKAWQVTLKMDTPAVGEFYAHLRYVAETLKVTFWSESGDTLQEARKKFKAISDVLAGAGISVDHVLYRQGKPPQADNQLSYSLVDIKT